VAGTLRLGVVGGENQGVSSEKEKRKLPRVTWGHCRQSTLILKKTNGSRGPIELPEKKEGPFSVGRGCLETSPGDQNTLGVGRRQKKPVREWREYLGKLRGLSLVPQEKKAKM